MMTMTGLNAGNRTEARAGRNTMTGTGPGNWREENV